MGRDWGWGRRRLITRGTRLRDTSCKTPSKSRADPLEANTLFRTDHTLSTKQVGAYPLKGTVDARISGLGDAGVSPGVYGVTRSTKFIDGPCFTFVLAFVLINSPAESVKFEEYITCERGLNEAWVAGKVGTMFCLGLRMGLI